MFARHIIHIVLGLTMPELFTWSLRGIGTAVVIALASQVLTLGIFRALSGYRVLTEAERAVRKLTDVDTPWRDYLWGYLMGAGWYTVVTLVAAQVARSQG